MEPKTSIFLESRSMHKVQTGRTVERSPFRTDLISVVVKLYDACK